MRAVVPVLLSVVLSSGGAWAKDVGGASARPSDERAPLLAKKEKPKKDKKGKAAAEEAEAPKGEGEGGEGAAADAEAAPRIEKWKTERLAKEDEKHAHRLARIAKIEAIATEKANAELTATAAKLKENENKRHDEAVARINDKATKALAKKQERADAKAEKPEKGKGGKAKKAGKKGR